MHVVRRAIVNPGALMTRGHVLYASIRNEFTDTLGLTSIDRSNTQYSLFTFCLCPIMFLILREISTEVPLITTYTFQTVCDLGAVPCELVPCCVTSRHIMNFRQTSRHSIHPRIFQIATDKCIE